MKRVKSNLASTAALAWLLTQTGLMMKFTFLRYTLVLSTFGTFMILGGSNRLVAQNSPVVSQVEPAQAPPIEPPAPALEETAVTDEGLGYQALVQGPVHEAFAAPVPTDHSQGIRLFDQPPPAPIDEQPPETQADVVGMKWIAGYWTWSDEVSDYVWVSGLWRKVPQGRIWNPGYWSETQSGLHRWTSGYWGGQVSSRPTPIDRQRAQYGTAWRRLLLGPRQLGIRRCKLPMEKWLLEPIAGRLGLAASVLRVHAPWLRDGRRLLGLPAAGPRSALRTGHLL
jgi:WXXGXW repeat (2 copies)